MNKGFITILAWFSLASLSGQTKTYNARLDKATKLPRLSTRTRVFPRSRRDLFGWSTVSPGGQSNFKRISAGARLQLGPALLPGEYVLQIIVEDRLAKRIGTRLVQFEVVSGQ